MSKPRFLDIHIVQSVPFSNLNRDDTNSVKTVEWGGSLRTRISSQSWKRATSETFQKAVDDHARRTRRIGEAVTRDLADRGWPQQLAERAGAHAAAGSSIKYELAQSEGPDGKKKTEINKVLTNAMVYVPATAVRELADLAEEHRDQLEAAKDIKKPTDKSVLPKDRVEAVLRSRNGVINLFGRMLAEVDGAGVPGAVQVAHAMTTHENDVEIDYFSTVDDFTHAWNDATGSAHMGHTEHSAGTFYRYATIDLDELHTNLGDDPTTVRQLVQAFCHAFTSSLPQAKKNSTAAHTLPHLVHVAVRDDRPVSFAAAFEKPVRAAQHGGHAAPSVGALTRYAAAASTFLGTHHLLHQSWTGVDTPDAPDLGERAPGLDALIDTALDHALTTPEGALA
ncbi:type I-E CRISPR-associated protein Cas7/Cse4/CasC [Streptomyces albidoflavus]